MSNVISVPIDTGRPYNVLIGRGLLDEAGKRLAALHPRCTVALVSDDRVSALYGGRVAQSLTEAGFRVVCYTFPHGESSKSLSELGKLLEFLAVEKLTRTDMLAALGGGVTGDLAGFAASVYLRGVDFFQLPTTLLAAVDSSVGGKTAVNLAAGKNLCGSFCQPRLVLCDPDAFDTLDPQTFADGLAESIKYGVLCDRALFDRFSEPDCLENLSELAARCVEIKGQIVAKDEFDNGDRQLLNLGHTLGHAVEKLSGFSVSHGHAVAIGMAMMARAADRLEWSREPVASALTRVLELHNLPTVCPYSPEELAEAALSDKKRRGDTVTLVVPVAVGEAVLRPVPVDELIAVARAGMEEIE